MELQGSGLSLGSLLGGLLDPGIRRRGCCANVRGVEVGKEI